MLEHEACTYERSDMDWAHVYINKLQRSSQNGMIALDL